MLYISLSKNLKLIGTVVMHVSWFKKEYLYIHHKAEVNVHLISSGKFFRLNEPLSKGI